MTAPLNGTEKKRGAGPSTRSSRRRTNKPATESGVRSPADELAANTGRLSGQMERAQRYISAAAHEILTPLTVAKGEIELALRHGRDAELDRLRFEVLLGQIQHLITLSKDMLTLATAGAPEVPRARAAVRLKDVVDDAVRASLAASPVVRVVDLHVDDLVLQGRAEDLVRLVRNVVENSMEHGPEGSRIRVEGRLRRTRDDKAVELSVEDEGTGIPLELHERIFEPFYRVQRARYHAGAGLGLAIAREIARAHGGDLWVDASREKTRFVAVLPMLPA